MIGPTAGATILVLALIAGGMVLGFAAAVMALAAACKREARAAFRSGRRAAFREFYGDRRKAIIHDLIASDTAAAFADRESGRSA